jgi:hypothetical protein
VLSWTEAYERCEQFNGGSGWRMPSMDELYAMCPTDFIKTAPFHYEEYFWSDYQLHGDEDNDDNDRYALGYLDSGEPQYSCGDWNDTINYSYGSVCIRD